MSIDHYIEREQWPDAESLIHRAIAQFGINEALNKRLLSIYIANDSNDEAWELANRMEKTNKIFIARCQLAFRLEREHEGKKILKKIIKDLEQYDADDIEELARDLYYNHHFEQSSLLLKWLLKDETHCDESLYQLNVGLALCSSILEEDDAVDYAKTAVSLRPDDPLARALLGNSLIDQGGFDEGINLLKQVGMQQLLHLHCEDGAKRLLRWVRKNNPDGHEHKHLTMQYFYWQKHKRWSPTQVEWVKTVCNNVNLSSFIVDCKKTERSIGFSYDQNIANRPLVNLSVSGRKRDCVLEEASFLGISCYQDSHIVARWFDSVGEKVITEPYWRFWEILQASCTTTTSLS